MILTMQSYVQPIHQLAKAWGNSDGISLSEWVENEDSEYKTLILQQNPNYEALSEALGNLALTFTSKSLLALPDDNNREVYFFFDEVFHLNFDVIHFMTTSRSKGARIILGIQDLALLNKKMTKDEVMALGSMVGSTIVLRVGSVGESINQLATSLGEQQVERLSTQFDLDDRVTHSWQRTTLPLVTKDDLRNLPQPTLKNGVQGYLSVAGTALVAKLKWKLVALKKHSPAYVYADWTKTPESKTIEPKQVSEAEEILDSAFEGSDFEEVADAND